MKRVILFIGMITLSYSVPAYKGDIEFKQVDGSSFVGNIDGDEWFNWVEDKDGNIIKYNKNSKNYEYGVIKEIDGEMSLVPSGIKVRKKIGKESGLGVNMMKKIGQASVDGVVSPNINKIDKKELFKLWKQKREKAMKYRRFSR